MIAERKAGLPQSLLLLIGSCLPVLGAVLLAPVLPRMQEHFSSTPGVAILVPVALTLPALVIALLAPFAGVIADRIGRKVLLLSGMFIYTLCGVMPLWLESLEAIVISRAGIGLAEAAIMTCCTTLVGDYFDGAKREHLFALQMVSTSLSAAVFMGVGGMLGESGWRTPFALYTVGLLFLPLMAVLLWEPRQRARDESVTAAVRFPWRALLPIYGLTLLAGASLFIVPVQVGYLLNLLHVNAPQQIGITMGASQLGVLAGALSFRLLGTHSPTRLLFLAFAMAAIGDLLMAFAQNHFMVIVAVLINGLGIGLMLPTLITWAMSLVDFHHRGRASGGFTAAIFAGEFLSPLVVLAVTRGDSSELSRALMLVGALQLLVALGCLSVHSRRVLPLADHIH
jgi:MFS family permease